MSSSSKGYDTAASTMTGREAAQGMVDAIYEKAFKAPEYLKYISMVSTKAGDAGRDYHRDIRPKVKADMLEEFGRDIASARAALERFHFKSTQRRRDEV